MRKLPSFVNILLVAGVVGIGFSTFHTPTHAAPVTAYIDLTGQAATAPSTIAAAPELATSTADEFYISYVASTSQFAAANTVAIQVPSSFTSLALCSSSTTNADGDATPDGSLALNGTTFTYTFSAATTTATTTGVEFCFAATTPSSAGNYSVAITDSNDTDSSAALIYVGDANDVTVTAVVPVSLSLRIKEAATTTDTNVCQLGVLNPAAVSTCTYRVAAGTSHSAGMFIRVIADDQLNTVGDTADIDDIAGGDNAINAGTEEYGMFVSAGGAFTIAANYTTYEDIPTAADTEAPETTLTATGAVNDSLTANWATVVHGASINTSTSGGDYTQVVSYRAYANV